MSAGDDVLCPVLAEPYQGIITRQNQGDLKLSTYTRTEDTTVRVQCIQPSIFRLVGQSTVTCRGGVWQPGTPYCERITRPTTTAPEQSTITVGEENTIILAVIGAILCALLIAVIIILTYLLCKWWNRKTYVAKRVLYEDSTLSGNATPHYDQPSTSFNNFSGGSTVEGASGEFNKVYQGRLHLRRSSDVSARTSSTTFSRHSMIVLPKPAYSHHYGPFWYYPIPDDQGIAGSAMRSVMDYHEDVTSVGTEPNPMYDPEVDYLQYPDEATAVDTMGRSIKYRPVVVGSEAGTARTGRYRKATGKGRIDTRSQRSETEIADEAREDETREKTGLDNPAVEVQDSATEVKEVDSGDE